MTRTKKRGILTILICLILVGVLAISLYNRPKILQRTMPGVILNKKTHKMIANTSVSLDLKHYRGEDKYKYSGSIGFENLDYTKNNMVKIFLYDGNSLGSEEQKKFDPSGCFTYLYSNKVNDSYQIGAGTMLVTVGDPALSRFVVTQFEPRKNVDTAPVDNNEIMVFPAKTEQEALDVINQFKSKDLF